MHANTQLGLHTQVMYLGPCPLAHGTELWTTGAHISSIDSSRPSGSCDTYSKVGMTQRSLAWSLLQDDTEIYSVPYLKKKKEYGQGEGTLSGPAGGNSEGQFLEHDLQWGGGEALRKHTLSPAHTPLSGRSSVRGGPQHGLVKCENWGRSPTCLSSEVTLIAMAPILHSWTPLIFHPHSTQIDPSETRK